MKWWTELSIIKAFKDQESFFCLLMYMSSLGVQNLLHGISALISGTFNKHVGMLCLDKDSMTYFKMELRWPCAFDTIMMLASTCHDTLQLYITMSGRIYLSDSYTQISITKKKYGLGNASLIGARLVICVLRTYLRIEEDT